MKAQELRELAKTDRNAVVHTFLTMLKDFGYPVTSDYVDSTISDVLAGKAGRGGPGMFIEGWLREGVEVE